MINQIKKANQTLIITHTTTGGIVVKSVWQEKGFEHQSHHRGKWAITFDLLG